MDAWWESLDRAFAAWTQAIDESGLTWKYRQVESGEWNTTLPDLDAPLPWDHLDTGIDKAWLKADLEKALAAAIVPDCSFEGCSHCGVCGTDFGHNVVVPPLPIPAFDGQFVPNQNRVQRVRVWFGKLGNMALISHLDLIRLFDRVIRRAAIPIAFTGGFHPGPRIALASALSLGVTSSGEIVDFDLTQVMAVEEFQQRLAAQLPAEMPIFQVEAIDPNAPSATQRLDRAEYLIRVNPITADDSKEEAPELPDWQNWIEQIQSRSEIWMEQTTKSGQVRQVNLRDRLLELHLVPESEKPELEKIEGWPRSLQASPLQASLGAATLRFIGLSHNDGNLLRPEHVIEMLQQVSDREFQLLHIHRQRLYLS